MSLTVDEVDFHIFEEPLNLHIIVAEAVVQNCSVKKMFLNISQNLQKTPVFSSWKRLWPQSCNYIKKDCKLKKLMNEQTIIFLDHQVHFFHLPYLYR